MQYTDVIKGATTLDTIPLYDDLAITWELMGLKEIAASVESPAPLNIPVGSYIQYKGEQYTVNTVPSVSKEGEHLYKYNITFESVLYRLYDKKLHHLNNRTFQDFGNPAAFAQLVVDNINEIDSGWTVGVCDDLDPKTINFSGHTCRTALDTVAEAFGLEWDVTGKVIRFTKQVGITTPYVFKYGQGNGLYTLSYAYQNDKNIVTRAYGYGSTRNLPKGYRSGATQLMFAEGYLENNVNLYGVKEGDYINEDIYPEVKGVVSAAPAWTEDDTIFKVTDNSLTFNLNDYKSAETPKLSFTTGELQGQEFEIISYNNTTHTYTLKVFQDGNNQTLPRIGYGAAIGDKYTLFDMPLPTELVTAAEVRLRAATMEWLTTNSKPQVKYSMDLDPLYARDNNIMLKPGDRVTIQDTALGINELIRVSKVQYPVNFPEEITPSTKITIEIANFVPYTLTERVLSDIKDTKQEVIEANTKLSINQRITEALVTKTGIDWLPPGTLLIDPATGSISASLLLADLLVARQLKTGTSGARIEISGNTITSYNPNGKVARKQSIEDGIVKDTWYDLNGNKILELGQNGIIVVTDIPESWALNSLRLLSNNLSATLSDLNTIMGLSTSTCLATDPGAQDAGYIGIEKTIDAYYYKAGQNATSAGNTQYEGYKTANNNRTSNIPDGWYTYGDSYVGPQDNPSEGIYIRYIKVQGGKQTQSTGDFVTVHPNHNCSF